MKWVLGNPAVTYTAPSRRRLVLALAQMLLATACSSPPPLGPPVVLPPMPPATGTPVTYRDVQPIIEQRCVVCHGCYDAPCQLLLSSGEGLERGASKAVVYDGGRLHAAAPTRLFVDAHGPAAWRQRGFFTVTGTGAPSLLYMMLALGRAQAFAPDSRLPDAVGLDINRALSCPTSDEFGTYARAHRQGGMPYGMAPLADAEYATLVAWIAQGAPPPPAPPPLSTAVATEVARWERFLNGTTLEQRITGRYLYEHWFVAHLYFADVPSSPFFRVVRSTTPPGTPIDEIATRRPYDPPGVDRFWYRLRPLDETIVHKTHITYPLDDAKLRRLTALFVDTRWKATRLPSYAPEEASNPFVTFDQIPARSRYQYMLDDAQYFVMTFIRGPVCRGQVAVDVIEDHFFAAFLDPDHDMSVVDPTFLERTKGLLALPAEHLSSLAPGEFFVQYGIDQRRYLDVREQYYDALDPEHRGPTLDAIWNGDGDNPNAQLTIFRHFDSASVVRGFLGDTPKTAWVLDYPLFERIYYDLVAGYDVFGNLAHQAATRLYMDHLRMQAENLFLAFLPADRRDAIRASWYVGATHSLDYLLVDRMHSLSHGTQIPFTSPDVQRQLLDMIVARTPAVSGPPDLLNRCAAPPCDRPGASPLERSAERALQPLTGVRGPWVAQLPEVSFLRVRSAGDGATYTLLHNRAHTNVAYMFDEAKRLVPADDTLTVARGYVGSYPNFLFDVDVAEIDAFTTALAAVTDAATMEQLVTRWGVRRTSPAMWRTIDWIHADFRRQEPIEFGLFDLDRFGNL